MKKINRLCRESDIQSLLKHSSKVKTTSYATYVSPNKVGHLRTTVSTSKKLGNAVRRNRIRRQVREMLHTLLNVNKAYDVFVVVKPDYIKKTFHENFEALQEILTRSGGLND